jgi:MYXO-CTERM domain-containing protein
MEAEDPLSELADIHLPDAVSMWPPAPGWWLLAALVLFALVLLCRQQLARLFLRRKLGVALNELERVYQTFQTRQQDAAARNQAGLDLLYGFNAILKRVALLYYADAAVPKLTGAAWLRFLDQQDQGSAFSNGAGQALGYGTYRPVFDADVQALHALCRRWIMQCYLASAAPHKGAPGAQAGAQS